MTQNKNSITYFSNLKNHINNYTPNILFIFTILSNLILIFLLITFTINKQITILYEDQDVKKIVCATTTAIALLSMSMTFIQKIQKIYILPWLNIFMNFGLVSSGYAMIMKFAYLTEKKLDVVSLRYNIKLHKMWDFDERYIQATQIPQASKYLSIDELKDITNAEPTMQGTLNAVREAIQAKEKIKPEEVHWYDGLYQLFVGDYWAYTWSVIGTIVVTAIVTYNVLQYIDDYLASWPQREYERLRPYYYSDGRLRFSPRETAEESSRRITTLWNESEIGRNVVEQAAKLSMKKALTFTFNTRRSLFKKSESFLINAARERDGTAMQTAMTRDVFHRVNLGLQLDHSITIQQVREIKDSYAGCPELKEMGIFEYPYTFFLP